MRFWIFDIYELLWSIMALKQENQETSFLSQSVGVDFSPLILKLIWPIKSDLQQNLWSFDLQWLYKAFPKVPSDLPLDKTVDYCIIHFKDFWLLENMTTKRDAHQYMQREHQKSFAKAYFVPLLEKVFHFCDSQWHTQMAQAMLYNIKDETGKWIASESGHLYDQDSYIYPEGKPWEEYKLEPHEKRREYEYQWLAREYLKLCKGKVMELGSKNIWIEIFNMVTRELLSTNTEQSNYECIGVVMFLEKFIPHEFTYMQKARDRLFPWLTNKERHYIDDHILHDAEFHYEDILKWIDDMSLSDQQKQWIVCGIHKIVVARECSYSAFVQQIKPTIIAKIVQMPAIRKMKYGVTASLLLGLSLAGMNGISDYITSKNSDDYYTWLYDVKDIEKYEKKAATKHGELAYKEYFSWKSENFTLVDVIGLEALKMAVKEQKKVDI